MRYATTGSTAKVNSNHINAMKELLHDISDDIGKDTTASYILSNIAVLLKLVFGEEEEDLSKAIDTISKEHLGLHTTVPATPLHGITNQPTQVAMLPSSISQEAVVPVRYNPRIFHLLPLNPNLL